MPMLTTLKFFFRDTADHLVFKQINRRWCILCKHDMHERKDKEGGFACTSLAQHNAASETISLSRGPIHTLHSSLRDKK